MSFVKKSDNSASRIELLVDSRCSSSESSVPQLLKKFLFYLDILCGEKFLKVFCAGSLSICRFSTGEGSNFSTLENLINIY